MSALSVKICPPTSKKSFEPSIVWGRLWMVSMFCVMFSPTCERPRAAAEARVQRRTCGGCFLRRTGRHYLSFNATCLMRPHSCSCLIAFVFIMLCVRGFLVNVCYCLLFACVLCVFRNFKDRPNLLHYSPLLKNLCVRRVVFDRWFPLIGATPCSSIPRRVAVVVAARNAAPFHIHSHVARYLIASRYVAKLV